MCGIFASIPFNKDWMDNAFRELVSRGPDKQTQFQIKTAGMVVTRLAITDVQNGDQPITSNTGNVVGIFNGAIYNTRELISNFNLKPTSFNDGAIAIELYEKLGLAFGAFINGMFSIILYDLRDKKIVAARDPIGIKPLYWVKDKKKLVFASWPSAFPKELYPTINAFKPGLAWANNGETYEWTIPLGKKRSLKEALSDSIRSHIPSEVPWGVMLSGGVDSSVICAIAAKKLGHTFPAYTIQVGENDDSHSAEIVCNELKIPLNLVKINTEDVAQAIPIVIRSLCTFEKDLVINGVGAFLVACSARNDGIKVLLSGEGADELFAGYSQYEQWTDERLNDVLIRHQQDLYSTECRRVDGSAMAASVEVRVPFLDNEVIAVSRSLSPHEKIRQNKSGVRFNKICLRTLAADLLPKSIAYRKKQPLLIGSGIDSVIANYIKEKYSIAPVSAEEKLRYGLSTKTEAYFFTIWREQYQNLSSSRYDMKKRGLARKYGTDLPPNAIVL